MSKHLLVTLLLTCGMPLSGSMTALANPEPQTQQQGVESITGTVYDENNEPVIGATVSANGAKGQGVMTDAFGHFTLKARVGAPITIGYVGYKTVEMPASRDMQVYLQPTTEILDQLVVVGYGEQKRANLTGAVSTVDVAKTMDGRPYQDVANALQGTVPGLTITVGSGDINESANMSIRGMGSLNGSSKPLIVVDGIEMDDISYLNTQDIESISVLKDAASASIYGTRAAFGVIMIQTKQASKVEKVHVRYTNNFAWNQATYLPEYPSVPEQLRAGIAGIKRATGGRAQGFGMNYDEILPYAELWEKQHNGPAGYREMVQYTDDDHVGDYVVLPSGNALYYANWNVRDIFFNDAAPSMSHNLSVNGTSGKTNYNLTFGYDDREGLLKFNPDKLKKYNAAISVNSWITDFFQVGARFNFARRQYERPNTYSSNPMLTLWRWGSWFGPYGTIDGNDFRIISDYKQASTRKTTTDYLRMTAYFNAIITKDLSVHGDFTYWTRSSNEGGGDVGYKAIDNWNGATTPSWIADPSTVSYVDRSNGKYNTWNFSVYADYKHTWNEAHNFHAMLGGTAEGQRYDYFIATRKIVPNLDYPELNLATGDITVNSNANHNAHAGYFGRLNYDYKGIYLLEVNGRYDGSSNFPRGNKWAFFPSVSAGYRFSEEGYFDSMRSWWSNGKLRASYGEVGNEDVVKAGSYLFIPTISNIVSKDMYWVEGVNGQKLVANAMPTTVPSSLTWERIRTTDIGLDLGFLNNSINVTFDWFQRENADMLAVAKTYPATVGLTSSPLTNAGSLRTRGWELSIGWNHTFGDWMVYANASVSDATTIITKWNNDNRNINENYSGKRYGDIWGFETDRYFTTADLGANGTLDYIVKDADGNIISGSIPDQSGLQNTTFVYGPGDIKFKDLNGDGVIDGGKGTAEDHGDLKVIGNTLPRYEYSFRIGGSWKGFDLDLFFQGVGKRDVWSISPFNFPLMRDADLALYANQTSYNVYDPENGIVNISESNDYPCLYAGNNGSGTVSGIMEGQNNYYPQSKYLINMAYLRLKNITFGYTLPVELTRKAYIENARVYFSCNNPCLLYKGHKLPLDPEVNGAQGYTNIKTNPSGNQSLYWGRALPITRAFSFGVQVTF